MKRTIIWMMDRRTELIYTTTNISLNNKKTTYLGKLNLTNVFLRKTILASFARIMSLKTIGF